MNPKQFLLVGGIVLTLVGILGFVGVIGPTAEDSLFGDFWWFDNAENWAHTVLGIIAVIAAYVVPASLQKPLVLILGIVGILVGLWSLAYSESFLGANLENPADTVLHIIVGAWALWAATRSQPMAPMA
ncbi:MAG: hypothetical protein HYT40_02255 [Candidatus Sungbacteria bacterium]|uniref:DUF4383 domain-containing protein n=1 Tax=Candidatus Sungiibacteriota bacterium TaxID=2750080 RepID=A0A931WN51_9BACT|nr:hypothetical protein [Candidatus Sungbacteria bacterium]